MKRKFSVEFKKDVVSNYPKLSIRKLSNKYDLSTSTIHRWLNEDLSDSKRYSNGGKVSEYPDEIKKRVLSDYPKLTILQISKKHNISKSTIKRWVKNLSDNKKKRYSEVDKKKIALEFPALSTKELAKKYNVSKTTISNWVRMYNKRTVKGDLELLSIDDLYYDMLIDEMS